MDFLHIIGRSALHLFCSLIKIFHVLGVIILNHSSVTVMYC